MAWQTPRRPAVRSTMPGKPTIPRTGATLLLLIAMAACVWVLAVSSGLIAGPGGGWAWIGAALVAPYLAAGFGGFMALAGLLDRLATRAGGPNIRLGAAAVALGFLVLWPRYLPTGILTGASDETVRRAADMERAANGEFMFRYVNQRVLSCRYLTFHGWREERYGASRPGQQCERWHWSTR